MRRWQTALSPYADLGQGLKTAFQGSHEVLRGQAHIMQHSLRRKGPCGTRTFHKALESD
jgi:hypothetical protein